jgi:hypothetical protein
MSLGRARIDGRMILKLIRNCNESEEWIHLAKNRDQ